MLRDEIPPLVVRDPTDHGFTALVVGWVISVKHSAMALAVYEAAVCVVADGAEVCAAVNGRARRSRGTLRVVGAMAVILARVAASTRRRTAHVRGVDHGSARRWRRRRSKRRWRRTWR